MKKENDQPIEQPKNIYEKLFAIMEAIETIHKDGYNKNQSYAYATEATIKQAVRKELIKNKVLFLCSIKSTEIIQIGERFITKLMLDVKFVNFEDEEEVVTFSFEGTGWDSTDKGMYKALTGAIKYCLTTVFLIPTGDDPENEKADSSKTEQTNASKQNKETSKKITPPELSDIVRETIEGAKSVEALIEYGKSVPHLKSNPLYTMLMSEKLHLLGWVAPVKK